MSSAPRSPVLVLGPSHSGSTLLGRMLDAHPRIACVGELMRLARALAEGRPCRCGAPLPRCPRWGPLLGTVERETGLVPRRFTPAFYRGLAAPLGADVVVDLSKTLAWRSARRWTRAEAESAAYVLLLRDSRGVLASALRAGKGLEGPLARHVKWMRRFERFTRAHAERTLVLRYEDLCADPARELRRLCAFAGVEFDARALRPGDEEHHLVLGSTSGYLRGSGELRLDERWRSELDRGARRLVEARMARVRLLREHYLAPPS